MSLTAICASLMSLVDNPSSKDLGDLKDSVIGLISKIPISPSQEKLMGQSALKAGIISIIAASIFSFLNSIFSMLGLGIVLTVIGLQTVPFAGTLIGLSLIATGYGAIKHAIRREEALLPPPPPSFFSFFLRGN